MKKLLLVVHIIFVVSYATLAAASDSPPHNNILKTSISNNISSSGDKNNAQICYAMAMMGKDSVINSRLGVPPEHVVDLARQPGTDAKGKGADSKFDTTTLSVMLEAYLWKGSPHSYADRVFSDCTHGKL
jgi:hypothetical protein